MDEIKLILFHSGKALPEYLEDTFRQIRLFNPDIQVYFLTDDDLIGNPLFKKYNIIPDWKNRYHSNRINKFQLLYGKSPNDFWTITATRLFYIENFIHEHNFTNVYHFENDVLLYYSLKEHHDVFIRNYPNLAITYGGNDKCMTGFMFIADWKSLALMTAYFNTRLGFDGVTGIKRIDKVDMVHEMSLMRIYSKNYSDLLKPIPSLPLEADEFNSLFDPAGWGQFVGGTRNAIPGAKPTDHYIGQLLIQNPEYTVIWKIDDRGNKIPYFSGAGKEIKINNLHIHSKQLNKYIS